MSAYHLLARDRRQHCGGVQVSMQPRQRSWAFDQYPEIPHGKQWVLKVKVPAASPAAQLMDMAGALQSGSRRHGSSWPTRM